MQGEVELAIAAAVQTMAALPPRRGVKRCNAGEHRKLGVASKALHARHLGHKLRRRQRPAAQQFKQRAGVLLEQRRKLTLERSLLTQKLLRPAGELAAYREFESLPLRCNRARTPCAIVAIASDLASTSARSSGSPNDSP